MCGIDGYIGKSLAAGILSQGLVDLAYRGYDSAGLATLEPGTDSFLINTFKCEGNKSPEDLQALMQQLETRGVVGIGHNRWATHGEPNTKNAHPHKSSCGTVAVVHNGIIDNYKLLRCELEKEGCVFSSDTDSEVLPNLIAREIGFGALSLEDAVHSALSNVEGTYAIAVISTRFPHEIVATRKSSDLFIGVSEKNGLYLISDDMAFPKEVALKASMRDGDIVTLRADGTFQIRGYSEDEKRKLLEPVCANADQAKLGLHAHYMIKEILEQPEALRNALRGRINLAEGTVKLGCFRPEVVRQLRGCERIVIVGCGTSFNSGSAGKLLIESYARVPVEVVRASEFVNNDPIFNGREVIIFISQSGTTADTLAALRLAKRAGALCLGITNRVGSTLAREDDGGVYLHAGPEKAVASTKAFTSQVAVLALMALKIAEIRGTLDKVRGMQLCEALDALPNALKKVLSLEGAIKEFAAKYRNAQRIICLGRGFAVPLAYEGDLKLKEIPYVDAHGFPGGELKHGPLALVEKGVPTIAIAPNCAHHERMASDIEEVITRGGDVLALVTEGNTSLHGIATQLMELPNLPEDLVPIFAAPVFQLLSYYLGLERESNIDRPRHLAKSVTV